MASDPQKKEKKEKRAQKARRGFLKKAVYSAPGLIVLGQLARPTRAKGESQIPDPPW